MSSSQNQGEIDICQFSQQYEAVNMNKNNKITQNQNSQKNEHIINESAYMLHKNKYITKLKNISNGMQLSSQKIMAKGQNIKNEFYLMNNQQQSQQSYPSQHPSHPSYNSLDKKQRNKQSAKQSRDRKKMYIEMLEEKQKMLNKKLLSKKKQLEQTKNYLDRVVSQNKTMSGFTVSRQQMIKKLQNILKYPTTNILEIQKKDKQLNQVMDSLRFRIGATGKQRVNTIRQYFRQIINLSLPALHRYMIWSASQENHLFAPNQEQQNDQWYKELKSVLNLTEDQKQEVKSKKDFLQAQKVVLQKLIGKLKNIKSQIQQKSIQLQDLVDGIRQILTPIQCANFILFIQKNKYRKQLNLCDQIDQEIKQKTRLQYNQSQNLRKLVKKQ